MASGIGLVNGIPPLVVELKIQIERRPFCTTSLAVALQLHSSADKRVSAEDTEDTGSIHGGEISVQLFGTIIIQGK